MLFNSRPVLGIAAAGLLALTGALPQSASAALISGLTQGCVVNTGGDCATDNLFNGPGGAAATPGFIQSNLIVGLESGPDFTGSTIDTQDAYQANFTNEFGGDRTRLSLFLAPPSGPFGQPITGPLTWSFMMDTGVGSTVGEDIVDVVALSSSGITSTIFDITGDSFSITTELLNVGQAMEAVFAIVTRPPTTGPVPAPAALGLALVGLALLPLARRRRR